MATAANGRFLAEMGGRRVNEHAAVAVARAAYIAGFDATSNLEAGRSWGIKTMGTAAHSFVLLHDTEEQAFKAQLETFGEDTTLLVDTFDIEPAVRRAIALAPNLGGVRLDSGDLGVEVNRVRALLDSLGATKTKITVTNDLDEFSIAALATAAVDAYGVGTSVATGSGSPTAGFVYKLVSYQDEKLEWRSVAKKSAQKTNVGGRKHAVRRIDGQGVATAEVIGSEVEVSHDANDRLLTVNFVDAGVINPDFLGKEATERAREHHRKAKAELPLQGLRLMRGEAAIPTELI
jgi:nicotinate phosphoribosyltransferase